MMFKRTEFCLDGVCVKLRDSEKTLRCLLGKSKVIWWGVRFKGSLGQADSLRRKVNTVWRVTTEGILGHHRSRPIESGVRSPEESGDNLLSDSVRRGIGTTL